MVSKVLPKDHVWVIRNQAGARQTNPDRVRHYTGHQKSSRSAAETPGKKSKQQPPKT